MKDYILCLLTKVGSFAIRLLAWLEQQTLALVKTIFDKLKARLGGKNNGKQN